MGTVHVRLDVDSEVHPELFEMLSAIERAATRADRLRQLAASGLVWEHLRVHGPTQAVVEIVKAPSQQAAAGSTSAQAVEMAVAPSLTFAHAPEPEAKVEAPAPKKRNSASAKNKSAPPVAVPTLYDAVDDTQSAEPHNVLPATQDEGHDLLDDPPAADGEDEDVVVAAPRAKSRNQPMSAGLRPRMLRMKEKGLFKNG